MSDCTNSVFNITDENNSFSINIPGYWQTKSAEKTIDELKKLLELDSVELHVKEVEKKGYQIIIGDKEYKLSEFFTFKEEILEELKKAKYKDLEDLVYRFQLTYDEIIDILDLKYIPRKRIGYSLKSNIYQISDINNTLKNILPDNVKIAVTIDEKKIYKSNFKTNQTLIFTNKSFFYTILGFTQSRSYPLDDIDGFYQLIEGSYESDKPINITGVDEVHLKCDCIDGGIMNGTREPILYCFALDQPPGHKYTKNQKSNFLQK